MRQLIPAFCEVLPMEFYSSLADVVRGKVFGVGMHHECAPQRALRDYIILTHSQRRLVLELEKAYYIWRY